MNEHFIKNIKIKNFKCFENFKAEGFGRVNLIGGKNNVGKTAFMEACYLGSVENKHSKNFIEKSIIIELNRNSLDFLLQWLINYEEFQLKYLSANIVINNPTEISDESNNVNMGFNAATNARRSKPFKVYLKDFYKENHPPLINNIHFVSIGNNFNNYLINFIDEIKLANKKSDLNQSLQSFFDITEIDIIKNKVMLNKESNYLLLSEFGDGVKHFLSILLALHLNNNSILYLDEIENGIHYTNLDKLWEIILSISKEQNVQVFATTHSKECIESYARVAKKLDDEEIAFIELGRNKKNELDSVTMDSEMFQRFVKLGNEVRGW